MYSASWNSIQQFQVPQWLRDAKFGIYTHWGVYSVPACGPNTTWYPYNMYREGSSQYNHHALKYGDPSVFGYKDFIPRFRAEQFDADEWAELFRDAGAKFAGPVGEHHDGFSMWDTALSPWNARNMGPGRDVVGELEKAIRRQGMRFMTAMHHAETWWFYPHWKKQYDVSNPAFSGLYGDVHDLQWEGQGNRLDPNPHIMNHHEFWPSQEKPTKQFLDLWIGKLKEIVDLYSPDLMWFDFAMKWIQEHYKLDFVSHYYNHALKNGKEVAITYKWNDLAPGAGVEDIEQGRRQTLAYNFWVTDTTVDDGEAWGFMQGNTYKTPTQLLHYLIDNTSKNGALLLSLGPRADGVIPDEVKEILREMGRWLQVNGEAIYGTTPWLHAEEGPTRMMQFGPFCEKEKLSFTHEDFRFTARDECLYAICLGRPKREAVIRTAKDHLYPGEIGTVNLLGHEGNLAWKMTEEGLVIEMPEAVEFRHACTLKIVRKHPFC